jgi:DNA polymerase-3 subunit alpha
MPAPETAHAGKAQVEPWSEEERLNHEKATLGLYLTGHPIGRFEGDIVHFITDRLGPLAERHDRNGNPEGTYGRRQEVRAVVAGLVVELRTKQNKNGKRMGFATLDDRTGRLEVAVFSEAFDKFREYLVKDTLLVAEGNLSWDDFAGQLRLSADNLMSMEQARVAFAKRLTLYRGATGSEEYTPSLWAEKLQQTLSPFRGGHCPVFIEYQTPGAQGLIQFSELWQIRPEETLLGQLRSLLGDESVILQYS